MYFPQKTRDLESTLSDILYMEMKGARYPKAIGRMSNR